MQPEDVEGQEFVTGVRGYVRQEVDLFLEAVADELRERDRKIEELSIAAGRQNGSRDVLLSAMGGEVAKVLQAADETARDIRDKAAGDLRGVRQAATSLLASMSDIRTSLDDLMRSLHHVVSTLADDSIEALVNGRPTVAVDTPSQSPVVAGVSL